MSSITTESLTLVLKTAEDVRAMIDGLSPSQRAELSAEWLALVETATEADPWVHGYSMINATSGEIVGSCGFKGPPTAKCVEIAYGVDPDHQGRGFATEAASALTAYAFRTGDVRVVRAHTLPKWNASTRVLTKSGFQRVGEVTDPDDGLVWRWEKSLDNEVSSPSDSTSPRAPFESG